MLGTKIKYLLHEREIKQITLARTMNISPSRLSNYISGKREPDIQMLSQIARFLRVDLNYFADIRFTKAEIPVIADEPENIVTVEVPCRMLNAPKYATPHRYIFLDKTLLEEVAEPLIIESCVNTHSVGIKEGALLLVEDFKGFTDDIKFLIQTGRDYKIYRHMKISDVDYLETLPKSKLVFVNPDEHYYAVKWILQ